MRTSQEILALQVHKKAMNELFNVIFKGKETVYHWFVLLNRDMILEILEDDELMALLTEDELSLLQSKVAILEE